MFDVINNEASQLVGWFVRNERVITAGVAVLAALAFAGYVDGPK